MLRQSCTALVLVLVAGCAQQRQYTLSVTPRDAAIQLNGVERAKGFYKFKLSYSSPQQVHSVVIARPGFEDLVMPLNLSTPAGVMSISLKPRVRWITINVEPAEAELFLDEKPISDKPVSSLRFELPYQLDAAMRPVLHTIRAQRKGYAPVETPFSYDDVRTQIALALGKLQKDLIIKTTPPGARITLDGIDAGVSPLTMKEIPFLYEPRSETFVPRTLQATRTGYPTTTLDISWENGKTEYALPLTTFSKTVRIDANPADAKVLVDGKEIGLDAAGARTVTLDFPPTDEAGTLPEISVQASVSHENELWEPLTSNIAWDEGQSQYTLTLEEILIRKVSARAVEYRADDGKWMPILVDSSTTAWKDLTDGPLGAATRVTDLPVDTNLAHFSISPDGKLIVYSLVEPDSQGKPKTRLFLCRSDGVGGSTSLTDGRSIDLTPAFSPSGDAILFSSDRGGGKLQVWSIPIDGQSGATRLTAGEADHLYGSLDSSPKPRVFYQALVPGQDVPKIYSNVVGTVFETDLVQTGGLQPRLSPRNDVLAFVQFNNSTRKTDIVSTGDNGGVIRKITDSPDVTERDPAWSPDGTRLAMTAEVPYSNGEGSQTDIYLAGADGRDFSAVTMNNGLDDLPCWSPTGEVIYFRSNRGGKWDLWKIAVK